MVLIEQVFCLQAASSSNFLAQVDLLSKARKSTDQCTSDLQNKIGFTLLEKLVTGFLHCNKKKNFLNNRTYFDFAYSLYACHLTCSEKY